MHAIPPDMELALFKRVGEGDEEAFTRVFYAFTPRLYGHLLRLTREEHTARELVQEAFLKLWVKRERLITMEQPVAWLFRIASNLSLDYMKVEANRRRIRSELTIDAVNAVGTEEIVEAREVSGLIARAVDRLPEKRREIYTLSREQGFSHQEIADRLGISVQTVKNQLGTAVRSIQEILAKETGLSMAVIGLLLSFRF